MEYFIGILLVVLGAILFIWYVIAHEGHARELYEDLKRTATAPPEMFRIIRSTGFLGSYPKIVRDCKTIEEAKNYRDEIKKLGIEDEIFIFDDAGKLVPN